MKIEQKIAIAGLFCCLLCAFIPTSKRELVSLSLNGKNSVKIQIEDDWMGDDFTSIFVRNKNTEKHSDISYEAQHALGEWKTKAVWSQDGSVVAFQGQILQHISAFNPPRVLPPRVISSPWLFAYDFRTQNFTPKDVGDYVNTDIYPDSFTLSSDRVFPKGTMTEAVAGRQRELTQLLASRGGEGVEIFSPNRPFDTVSRQMFLWEYLLDIK